MSRMLIVPFVNLPLQFRSIEQELMEDFRRVGNGGMYILGAEVSEFEERIKEYCDVKHAIGVGNGSDALFLCMKGLGIGRGDEVIAPANSFIATAWTIIAANATPVLVDVQEDYNIDPNAVCRAITSKTKAIIVVHMAGRPAAMDEINALAKKNGIYVLEDAAQAIGARYRGRPVGSLGTAAGFSLHPLKNLGVYGDGGFVTTNDDELAKDLLLLRNHGLANRNKCDIWGYNSRLDTLQAAFALTKLKYLNGWNDRCRGIARMYREGLKNCVVVPDDNSWEINVYHNFIIRTTKREELRVYLENCGIGTAVHYPVPIHLQPAASGLGYAKGSFPKSEMYASTMLSLPIYPELDDAAVNYVIECVGTFLKA